MSRKVTAEYKAIVLKKAHEAGLKTLDEVRGELFWRALDLFDWNISTAAIALDVSEATVRRWIARRDDRSAE